MRIVRMQREDDKAAVMALWDECFHDPEAFTAWFFSERWLPEYGVVTEDDGQIVGAMQGYPYALRLRGKIIPACMLSGVSTLTAFRNQGIMQHGLQAFMQNACKRGEAIVFNTPARHETYFKCLHYSATDIFSASYAGAPAARAPEGVMIESIDDSMAETLLPVYQTCTRRYSCCVERSLDSMAQKLRDYASDGGKLILCSDERGVLGYAACSLSADEAEIQELAAPDLTARDRLLTGFTLLGDGRTLSAKLPPDIGASLPAGFQGELRPRGVMGLSDVRAALALLGGFDDVAVRVYDHMSPQNDGVFTFDGKRTLRAPDVTMDSGRLLQLLSGYASIEELATRGQAEIHSESTARILSQRFPKEVCYVAEEY